MFSCPMTGRHATIQDLLPRHPEIDEDKTLVGARLGNYVLKDVIGRGGMGVVYRAEHVYIHKPAAVKVLHRRYFDNPDARRRFLHEAQTASVIDHPNIIGVNDFGEAPDGTIFLVMAHVEGIGLDRLLRKQRTLALFRCLGILNQITRALGAAHLKGVVHRDLKPENIMLANRPGRREIVRQISGDDGEQIEVVEQEKTYDFVTILDFGAAKFWHQSTAPLGANATVIGTPAYMAPETAKTGVADARSDIYSVGVIFYEMLTGSIPFDGDDATAIMIKQVSERVEPPRLRNPNVEITPEAERVILRALEKQPLRRYQSMEELNADLRRCFGVVRFKRPHVPVGGSFEAMRRPIALTPDKIKRKGTISIEVPTGQGLRATTATVKPLGRPTTPSQLLGRPTLSGPILLTRRKSGRHQTLPIGSSTFDLSDPSDEQD
jgi:serine/threonine protein kinase